MPCKLELFATKETFRGEDIFGVDINEALCEGKMNLSLDAGHAELNSDKQGRPHRTSSTRDRPLAKHTCNTEVTVSRQEPTSCRRRMALADVFENISCEDMARVLALYVKYEIATTDVGRSSGRRGAKPDIFEGVSPKTVEDLLRQIPDTEAGGSVCDCGNSETRPYDLDSEVCDSVGVSTDDDKPLLHRRVGKVDIFEGMSDAEKQDFGDRLCVIFHSVVHSEEVEPKSVLGSSSTMEYKNQLERRGGQFDIFDNLSKNQKEYLISYIVDNYHS